MNVASQMEMLHHKTRSNLEVIGIKSRVHRLETFFILVLALDLWHQPPRLLGEF